ncbi:MAG: DUF2249 domain-containing protein [Propionibacteriaceae bacterium]|nr:DUF2249 domain-containing protein [Propionibacteriaceae bacterium]
MTDLNITEKKSSCACGAPNEALPELDVRVIPHAVRHAAIHGVVDNLAPGAAVVIVANHDPLPLLAQISQRHGSAISPDYLESGPEVWKLKLERV